MARKTERHRRVRPDRIDDYAQFWAHYLREHRRAETRQWHFFGTAVAIACLCGLAITRSTWFLLATALAAYGPAWIAHATYEKNWPATFTHPLWSLVSDLRMFGLWLTGRLGAELARAGVPVRRRRGTWR
jgi:hypothetical protein